MNWIKFNRFEISDPLFANNKLLLTENQLKITVCIATSELLNSNCVSRIQSLIDIICKKKLSKFKNYQNKLIQLLVQSKTVTEISVNSLLFII